MSKERSWAAYEHFMPIKCLSTPDKQAAAVAPLVSDEASYGGGVSLDAYGASLVT